MELISHPDHPKGDPDLSLARHSTTVRDRVERLLQSRPPEQTRAARIAAYLHDFGKATPQFQQYVRERYDGPDAERYHARLGAYVTLYGLSTTGADECDTIAGALAVARHHQSIPDAARYLNETLAPEIAVPDSAVRTQIGAIEDQWPALADDLIATATDGSGSWGGFRRWVQAGGAHDALRAVSGDQLLNKRWDTTSDKLPSKLYDRVLRYWSALTLADKSHAAALSDEHLFGYDTLSRETLDRYVDTLAGEEASPEAAQLNDWRAAARTQALAGVHEWLDTPDAPSIATLTLPTGLGKTFTGTSAALTVRDRIEAVSEGPPVVVYALPYTSIIEQTRGHFEDPDIWDASPTDSAFTVHHHLSETLVKGDGVDEASGDDVFLGESWRSGVVLTTFVQLFESLTGPANTASTKLPALDRAVIVLDEPQALPKHWWDGIRRELELLTTSFDAHIISMTATQPALLDPLDTVSLLDAGAAHDSTACSECDGSVPPTHDVSDYFAQANRVTYQLDESAFAPVDSSTGYVGHDDAAAQLVECATDTDDSVLAVCNTIASSRALTSEVIEQADAPTVHVGDQYERLLTSGKVSTSDDPEEVANEVLEVCGLDTSQADPQCRGDDPPLLVATFNSRYRPADRRVLINVATALTTAGVPFVFVSTQAVEAGVDISFRTVYRDLAPLDSIVQAAGRCNRSFEWGPEAGTVVVWTLADPESASAVGQDESCPAQHVYRHEAPGHLSMIAETLAELGDGTEPIPDQRIAHEGVRRYFNQLASKSVASQEIREDMDRCRGRALGDRSLIQDYDTVDVLVAVTPRDRTRIDEVGDLFTDGQRSAAYNRMDQLTDLRVSVPVHDETTQLDMLTRVDRQEHAATDGIPVLVFRGQGGEYDLSGGGLSIADAQVSDRFTI